MVDKLHEYEGPIGRLHKIRDNVKSNYSDWKENHADFKQKIIADIFHKKEEPDGVISETNVNLLANIRRPKTRWELLRLCAVVMGIEFAYAAITAFSGPILLEIGIPPRYMSFVFSLAPILGFFLSPLSGSLSDRCTFRYGRRRIFIVIYAIFEIIGLLLMSWGATKLNIQQSIKSSLLSAGNHYSPSVSNVTSEIGESQSNNQLLRTSTAVLFLTVIAIVISDFCSDGLQSPSRAYLLDVCNEDDHTRGLSTFTILAGLGGTIGYYLGSIDWDNSTVGHIFGGHIRTVFGLTTILFTVCVILTITTFSEVPLTVLLEIQHREEQEENSNVESSGTGEKYSEMPEGEMKNPNKKTHDSEWEADDDLPDQFSQRKRFSIKEVRSASLRSACSAMYHMNKESVPSLREYLNSVVQLPYSLKILLLTNVFCWMSHVSYSLYFTDYVGERIFGGDPQAPLHSPKRNAYEEGIRFACLGMTVYSFSCLVWSLILEKIIEKFGLRPVYIVNILTDSIAMFLMYQFRSKFAVIFLSFASGIIYCTLFTVPYIIIAHYHTLNVFAETPDGKFIQSTQVRGLGTDVSVIGSSVFIAQFFLSLFMGPLEVFYGSTEVVPLVCCVLSLFAALAASRVVYLDL